MTTAVRVTDNLAKEIKIFSKVDKSSLTGQIEHLKKWLFLQVRWANLITDSQGVETFTKQAKP